jgi:hypothetical protein
LLMQGALMFTVIMPAWEGHACWARLERSRFTARRVLLLAAEHGFCEGAQHNRANRYRAASTATSVFFLQSERARQRWPVSDASIAALRAAFAPRASSQIGASAAARTSCGAGDAGKDALMGGDFEQGRSAPGVKAGKLGRTGAKRARVAAAEGAELAPEQLARAHGVQASGAEAGQLAVEPEAPNPVQAPPKGAARKAKRKGVSRSMGSSTGKFAADGAVQSVLHRLLGPSDEPAALCHGPEDAKDFEREMQHLHEVSKPDGGIGGGNGKGNVVFAMSKSQRRAKRQRAGNASRQGQQQITRDDNGVKRK